MDIIRDIAIHLKDRIVVLDRDLLDRKVDVSKNSELYKTFHRIKGRHYKQLKQGPGWSFPLTALEEILQVPPPQTSQAAPPAQALQAPPIAPPAKAKARKEQAYEADIPNEVRLYFKKYEALIFS
jgi:hypothetical protein